MGYMKSLQSKMVASGEYLADHTGITPKMRTILIDWMVEVCNKYKYQTETLFLTVALLDRVLASMKTLNKNKLQLVGTAAMMLAAKYEEIWPQPVKTYIHITAKQYKAEELLDMERACFNALEFKLSSPTVWYFCLRGCDLLNLTPRQQKTCQMIATFALLEYKCLNFTPCQIAAACLYLTCQLYNLSWTPVESEFGAKHDAVACASLVLSFLQQPTPSKLKDGTKRTFESSSNGQLYQEVEPLIRNLQL
eukprot:NODE_177_length_1989_cov_74.845865_g153_i0.p1 GENE.NODE_177_length_1989_cov_74.845865_g153_i0~~NODE_177_length_1989_cov_74.845865_g153_i0.p1  ORF type:complete len:250 (-),score=52.90 NODE_177_length_1989_cov_74.845865_g153_i0:1166-1915(-)